MASSRLTWVYKRQHRAKDVPKDVIDEYESIIRHLYLDQNMTRLEVISHLKDSHGFTLTTSQFAKATKRWGFYKQPRQAQTIVQALEATIVPEPEPLDAIFDIEVDASGADDENESLFHTVNTLVLDSETLKNIENDDSLSRGDSCDKNHHSVPASQRQPRTDEGSCKEPSRETSDTLQKDENYHRTIRMPSRKCQPAGVKSPIRIWSAPKDQIPLTSRCSPTRVMDQRQKTLLTAEKTADSSSDYLACCYLFQDSFDCIEKKIRIGGKNIAGENLIRQLLDLMRIARSWRMAHYAIDLLQDSRFLEAAERDADETSVLPYTSAQDRMLFHAYLSGIYALIEGLEDEVQRHLGRLRQIRDELLANPNCSINVPEPV
ncbi:hypothetical protein LZL87_013729 [Fusarium oxysporum]|nr:hypothetical protein LZL87_013729 [Fusarium oxysporum]